MRGAERGRGVDGRDTGQRSRVSGDVIRSAVCQVPSLLAWDRVRFRPRVRTIHSGRHDALDYDFEEHS